MDWVIASAFKFLQYEKRDFGLFLIALACTLALHAALYFFAGWASGKRSLSGLMSYLFPPDIFRQAKIDLFVFLSGKILWMPVVFKIVAFLALQSVAMNILNALFGLRSLALPNSWPVVVGQFLVVVLGAEFSFYWVHRILHENKLLWSLHRVHHSAEALTFLTAIRQHPLEILGETLSMGLGSGVAMAALSYATRTAMHPLLPSVFLLWTIFSQVMSNLQHSHLRTSFGPVNRIVMAGAMHHIHHSAELKHRDRNFGAMLCLFDWIFGTAYVPEPGETFRLGLSAEEIGVQNPHKRVIDVYAEPFAHARRVLKDRGLAV